MMMAQLGRALGYVAKALHWSAAALIITMLALVLPWCMPGSAQAQNSKPISFTRRLAFLFWR